MVWILTRAWTTLPLLWHSLCKRQNPGIGRLKGLGFIQHRRERLRVRKGRSSNTGNVSDQWKGYLIFIKGPVTIPLYPNICHCTERPASLLDSTAALAQGQTDTDGSDKSWKLTSKDPKQRVSKEKIFFLSAPNFLEVFHWNFPASTSGWMYSGSQYAKLCILGVSSLIELLAGTANLIHPK